MALDFGDAGLFDPIPNNKHSKAKDDENENVNSNGNGWSNSDNADKDHEKEPLDRDNEDNEDQDDEFDDWPTAPPLDILDCIKGYESVSFDATSVPPPPFEEATEDEPDTAAIIAATAAAGSNEDGTDGNNEEDIKAKVRIDLVSIETISHILLVVCLEKRKALDAAHVRTGPDLHSFRVVSHLRDSIFSCFQKQAPGSKVMIAPEIEPKLTEAQARAALLSHIASHCCYGKAAATNMSIKKMEYLPAYHYELQTFTEKRETSWTYAAIRTGYEALLGHGANGALGSGIPPLPWEIFEEPAQAFKDEVRLVQVN
jgi:hypothetical protein